MDEQAIIILNLLKKIEELETRLECIEQSRETDARGGNIFKPLANINRERIVEL